MVRPFQNIGKEQERGRKSREKYRKRISKEKGRSRGTAE